MPNEKAIKKISITTFDKIMPDKDDLYETIEWNGIAITIRKSLSLKQVLAFVDGVSKSCFDSKTNAYLPEVKVFAIKCFILEMYANFSLPANVEYRYDLIYNTDAVDEVVKHINTRQLDEIIDAINDKVDNISRMNIETVNKQINDVYSAFDTLQKQFEQIFSSVNPDDVSAFIQAVSSDKLDEEKLVQAYVQHGKPSDGE